MYSMMQCSTVQYSAVQASGKLHRKKKKRGGVKVQSKVKGALFATDRFPLGSLSYFLTSMVVLHFNPHYVLGDKKNNIKMLIWKVLPGGPK